MTHMWPDPDRLDNLVDGASAGSDDERALLDLLSELRADGERAPQGLRARVERLAEASPARRRWTWRPSWLALSGALAPVMAAAAIAVAVWPSQATEPRVDLGQARGKSAADSADSFRSGAASTAKPAPRATSAPAPAGGAREVEAPPAASHQGTNRRWPYVASLACVAAVFAIGFGWTMLRRRRIQTHV